jgi:hypothetical protein
VRIKINDLKNAEEYPSLFIEDNLTGETHDITNQPLKLISKQVSDKIDFNALCRKF